MLGSGVEATHLVRSGLDVEEEGVAFGFQLHEFPHLICHPRVVEHEVARRGQFGASVTGGEENAKVVKGFGFDVHFTELALKVDQRIEVFVLFT